MKQKTQKLKVSEGALVILGTCPMECNLGDDLKENSVWIPELLIAIPNKRKAFIIGDNYIHRENTPSFIVDKNGKGAGVWYSNKKIRDSLKIRTYFFEPGKLVGNEHKGLVYVLNNSFLLDSKDNKKRETTINIRACKGSFCYVDDRRFFIANVRIKDLYGAVNACLCYAKEINFGYNCEISGTVGLNPRFHGRMQIDTESRKRAGEAIIKDLESNLKLSIIM